jgi:1,2-diacylglycerol 3-beta-galactosyltransferase
MSDTGGGHRAAAQAIAGGFSHLYGKAVTVTIVDAWKNHTTWPVNRLANLYSWILHEAIWLWRAFWLMEHAPRLVDALLGLVSPLVAPGLLKLFQAHQPDAIISVHPLIVHFPLRALRRAGLNIPFVTVVTDMVRGYHTWYHPQTTLCLVPTEPAREQALGCGVPREKVDVVGQPVDLKFVAGVDQKNKLRAALQLDPHRPLVLLVGGGEGYGRVFEIARSVAHRISQVQLVVVAGRNRSLQKKLEAVAWEIPTRIYGFVDNMPELMGAADVFVSKAGPGSISEAFIARLPLILYDYIPGQEAGNVDYVVGNRAGAYAPEPEQIVALLLDWLQPGNPLLVEMTRNAARLARPDSAITIASRVTALLPRRD